MDHSNEPSMPSDWEDEAGWERYYSLKVVRGKASRDGMLLGSISDHNLPALINDLQQRTWTTLWFPGCGLSPLPKLLAAMGFTVHATDVSTSAIRFQQSDDNDIERLQQRIASACQPPDSPGKLTAIVHDFRTPFHAAAIDFIISEKAFQGFGRASMDAIAGSHFTSLRPGRVALFDTMNVQGQRRDEFEEALERAGFYVPLAKANRCLRRALEQTGIPHLFILGRPTVPARDAYADPEKRKQANDVLRQIFAEYENRVEAEYAKEQERLSADTRTANIIYSTG